MPPPYKRKLERALSKLARDDRTAFAAACAERLSTQMSNGRRKRGLRKILDQLWSDLSNRTTFSRAMLDECMSLIPSEEARDWSARSEDAAASIAYALRSFRSGKLVEARSAASRVLDSIEFELSDQDGDDDAWMKHPRILAEVERQRRDLDELARRTVSVTRLRARAAEEGKRLLPPTRKRGRQRTASVTST